MTTAIKNAPVEAEAKEIQTTEILPSRNAVVKQTADIDGFLIKRQEFIQKVNAICVEGKDYHIIQGKKSLAKGGAEKISSIFQWNAIFEKDTESLEMLGVTSGLVAFKCTLSKGNKFVGEGRGAASLQKNGGDPNKTLKMAQKSAFIDAVLRASGLSDFFTQDLEDMPREQIGQTPAYQKPYTPPAPEMKNGKSVYTTTIKPSEKQLELIGKLCKQKGYTKEDILDLGFNKLTGGKGGTASELIDYLMKAQAKITPNGEPIPTIQQDESYQTNDGHTVITDKDTGEVVDVPF